MRLPTQIIAIAIFGALVFQIGYSQGVRDCPGIAEVAAAHQEAIDRDVEAILSAPTSRDIACEEVFEVVARQMGDESIDDHEAWVD